MAHVGPKPGEPLKQTDWDNLGYYLYLPGIFTYHDIKALNWIHPIDSQYHMIGGQLYQANKVENGNMVSKYLGGVALMQTPFFFAGDWVANHYHCPVDGFSPPYQWAVAIAAIFYALLGLFFLRSFLLLYFKDLNVAISLLLVCLATNFLQYVAVDGGMSHAYIFPLYALILWVTKKWHDHPKAIWAAFIGYIIGLATICRPTEAVMLFIPLLWNTHAKEAAKAKWAMVKQHRSHIYITIAFGLIGIAPQLIYWKAVTGSFIYDVGSAWSFLTPHLRVLTGWEKGWFVYTPITIFFIIGLFFVKDYPFRKSAIWFCILNIYIITSWADWRYGGSYSTRALMQSYPIFALPFTAFIEYIDAKKWRWLFYALGIYLICVNLFQLEQYSKTILHYYDMNRKYYTHIYLNAHPTPTDMSLLDDGEVLNSEQGYTRETLFHLASPLAVQFTGNSKGIITQVLVHTQAGSWIKVDAQIQTHNGFWGGYLDAELRKGDSVKHIRVRLNNPISVEGKANEYTFYMQVPEFFQTANLSVYISRDGDYEGVIEQMEVTLLQQTATK
ncbi:MAG: hypothetical protein BGO70_00160 [Bacteroidetes bacterium 43-93]|nr:MAG: hypothetical protein BGO70_00160 [Bacteroidetes bacterium 43-93]